MLLLNVHQGERGRDWKNAILLKGMLLPKKAIKENVKKGESGV